MVASVAAAMSTYHGQRPASRVGINTVACLALGPCLAASYYFSSALTPRGASLRNMERLAAEA